MCTKTQCILIKKQGKIGFFLPSFGGFHQKPLYWSLLIRIPPCLFNLKRRCRSVSCKLEQRALAAVTAAVVKQCTVYQNLKRNSNKVLKIAGNIYMVESIAISSNKVVSGETQKRKGKKKKTSFTRNLVESHSLNYNKKILLFIGIRKNEKNILLRKNKTWILA